MAQFGLVKLPFFYHFFQTIAGVLAVPLFVSKLSSLRHGYNKLFLTSMEVFEVETIQLLLLLAESASIKSTSTTSSRPPTPFARPITAPVMARPKTTTIRFFRNKYE